MALLSPLFLIGALSAAVPVALHLLKRHPETLVRFSAVRMLRNAPVEHASRRHLRELLLLALRVAALVVLGLAFARPFFAASAADSGSAIVVALDTSFSMTGAGRFDRARTLAVEAIDRAAGGEPLGVVVFNDAAQVVSALSTDRALAKAAIAAAQPSASVTHYRSAIDAASELLRGRSGQIIVITDLQASGWDAGDRPALSPSIQLDVVDVGPAASNLAVTAVRAAGDHVTATLRNVSTQPAIAQVHLAAGATDVLAESRSVGDLRVPLDAGQSAEVLFPRPPAKWAAVSVADAEGPAADNVRYLVFDSDSRQKILVITATGDLSHDAFYLEQALKATAGDARSYDAVGVPGSALQSWEPSRLDAFAAIVLLSTRGLDHRGRELIGRYLQQGGGVLVATAADVDGDVLSETLGGVKVALGNTLATGATGLARTLAPVDGRHPVLRPFSGQASLGLVRFQRVATIRAERCTPLARFTSGDAAFLECESGTGRALLFASDLDNRDNDFPLHATFLPFVHEAIRYLTGQRRAADYLVGALPVGMSAVPGIVRLPGDTGALAAVNVDPTESEPARLTMSEFESAVARNDVADEAAPRMAATEREAQQHLWQYLLATMLALLLVEGAVAMRSA